MAKRLLFALAVALGLACGAADFDPASKVGDAVRVLAVRADHPYARPGETVTLEALAVDNRRVKARPMRTYWIPLVCINPPRDAYFACFAQLAGGAGIVGAAGGAHPPVVALPEGGLPEGGIPEGGADAVRAVLRPGVDLSPFLPEGPRFTFRMPDDAVSSHEVVPGAPRPYGLAVVFNVTCAGRVQIVDREGEANPQAPPIGCFDEAGALLPPEDYVIGFSRVYAYDELRNANPEILSVVVNGETLAAGQEMRVDRCAQSPCPKHKIDVNVPPSSQEERVDEGAESGRERLWATYYATDGEFTGEGRILYDSDLGLVTDRAMEWAAPEVAGDHRMWIVVRDNRGGASWLELPVVVR